MTPPVTLLPGLTLCQKHQGRCTSSEVEIVNVGVAPRHTAIPEKCTVRIRLYSIDLQPLSRFPQPIHRLPEFLRAPLIAQLELDEMRAELWSLFERLQCWPPDVALDFVVPGNFDDCDPFHVLEYGDQSGVSEACAALQS